MRKRKVYFLCYDITLSGGTERAIATTVNFMIKEDELQPIVISLSSTNIQDSYFDINADIIHCSLPSLKKSIIGRIKWYNEALMRVKTIVRESKKTDIIFSYGHNISIILPFIYTQARKYACEHINYHSIPRMSQLCMRVCYPKLDGIIALSFTAKNKLNSLNDNIIIIPNSIPFKVNCNVHSKNHTIIMVGRISSEKGYDRLVPIIKELKTKIPDWKIDIWGDGPDFEKIQELYKKEGIDNFVTLKGSTKDILSVYNQASLLIMTSYTEALPMVIIEANACGVPVVAYENEGSLELIKKGINGFIVEDNDYKQFVSRVLEIISTTDKYDQFSKSSINISKTFLEDEVSKKWKDLIYYDLKC